jgi:hypothetical protein
MDMEPKDGKGSGDGQRSAKGKRAPSARKRGPKAVKSTEENGATATEREVAPQADPRPAQGGPVVANRGAAEARSPGQRTSGERPADPGDGDGGDPNFGERDADRAADVAADLKSWLDTRREDRDAPREVL